jgi:PKD repeat protein
MKKLFTLRTLFFSLIIVQSWGQTNAQLILNVSKTNPGCYNDSTGRITVSASGATGPFTFMLIKGFSKYGTPMRQIVSNEPVVFDSLTSSSYSVLVSAQGANCSMAHEFITLDFPTFYPRFFSVSDSSCAPCDSRVSFVIEPVDSFTYVWSNGATTQQVTRICDGPISVVATHKRTGCKVAESTTSTGSEVGNYIVSDFFFCLGEEASFTLGQFTSDAGICQNLNPDDVTWDFGDGETSSGSLAISHTYLSPGDYTVVANHPVLGILASQNISVEGPQIFPSAQIDCSEPRSYSFQLGPNCVPSSGGDLPLWNFGDPASGASNTSQAFSPTHQFSAPGSYNVTVAHVGLRDSLRLDAANIPNELGGFSFYNPNCQFPLRRAFEIGMPCVGSPLWNFGDTASGASNNSAAVFPIHTFSAPGIFTVTLRFVNTNEDTVIKQQTISIALPPSFTKSANKVLQPDSSVEIGVAAQIGFRYLWNNEANTTPITVSQPGEYTFFAFPENDSINCPFQDTVLVAYCEQEVSVKPSMISNTKLKVWPNPTGNADAVSFNAEINEHFEVFHASGKRILAGRTAGETTELETDKWSKGLYILMVKKQNGQKQTARFMVN